MLLISCFQRPPGFASDVFGFLANDRPDIRSLVFLAALIAASVTDLRGGKIYDWLTLPLAIFALAHAAYVEWVGVAEFPGEAPSDGLIQSITGGLTCFGLMFLHYVTSGGGGGDVKLATAVGFGFGAAAGLHVIAIAYGLAWLCDTAWRTGRDVISSLRTRYCVEPGVVIRKRKAIRMAPWFLLAILPVLAGVELF